MPPLSDPAATAAAPRRRRPLRILAWVLGLLVGLPLLLVLLALVVVLVGANTGPGRRLIEREAASLSGGLVTIDGLHGRFPDALRADRIAVNDIRGPWLVIDDLRLDWSPLRLLGFTAKVENAEAARIAVARLPVPNPNAKPSPPPKPGAKSGLHLGIIVQRLVVDRLDVAAPVAGTALSARLDGHARIADLAPILDGVSIRTLPDTELVLALNRFDKPGQVDLAATVRPRRIGLHLKIDDPADGLVAALAHLPVLDPLNLSLDLDGPRNAAVLALSGRAGAASRPEGGPLTLAANGTIDLDTDRFDTAVKLDAPAMQPMSGVAWNKVALDAHLVGTPQAPGGTGHLVLDELAAAGAGIGHLDARFDGKADSGPVTLHAVADALRIPGPQPTLLAGAPLVLDATLDPHRALRPLTLALSHPLLSLNGEVDTAEPMRGALALRLPDLQPFAAIGHVDLRGHAALDARFTSDGPKATVAVDGPVAITGGQPQAVGLIGTGGQLSLAAAKNGNALTLDHLTLNGSALRLQASGTKTGDALDARFVLALPALDKALPTLRGALALSGTATGTTTDLAAHVEATGNPGTATLPPGPLHLVVDAKHLPSAPEGTLALNGTLDRAPLRVQADAERSANGALHVLLTSLDWRSLSGRGDLSLPAGARLPLGTLHVAMTRLADLQPVIGQAITGAMRADITTSQAPGGAPTVRLDIQGGGGLPTAQVAKLALTGTVRDPLADPAVDLRLDAAGLRAGAITGGLQLVARGPQKALAVTARAALQGVAGAPADLDTALVLDLPEKRVALSRLVADAKGETLRLSAPARIEFGAVKRVDHLLATLAPPGAAPATLDVAGSFMPRLDLRARISNVTPALAKPFAPTLNATGVIDAEANVTGTTARPTGTVRLAARDLRLRTGPAASLPPADLTATAVLAGTAARLDARLQAGPDVNLSVSGTAPTSATGPLALRTDGRIDLALANAILGAQGRELRGVVDLALGVAGTARAPLLNGTVRLENGQFQDFAQGVRLTDMAALITAQGQSLTLSSLSAKAGGGTITGSGTVGALVPGLPVDLRIEAHRARPLSSDLLTATLDADLRIHGQAQTRLDVGGTVTVDQADINVPNGLPPSVQTLDVIRPGEKPPAPGATGPGLLIGLDVTMNAPGRIFVRGHGLDAVLGGRLHVGGTSKAPVIAGGFEMRRGRFDLAGIALDFTTGKVTFNGAGVGHKIDPALDFDAQSIVGNTVARLHVGGYASAPKISLSSTPPLPQDQVLALILFGQDTKSLSPFQLAQVAAGLASLTGSGGGFDPLGTVRKSLGLDRLSVGNGSNGSGTSIEAGKYVANGVYVGARQAAGGGGGSQAEVQIDLTRHLKLLTTVGTGGATTGVITPQNDPGSSVALKYQFRY